MESQGNVMNTKTGSDIVYASAMILLFFALCAAVAQPLFADRLPGTYPAEAVFKDLIRMAAHFPNTK
jgi:hypothetical protein